MTKINWALQPVCGWCGIESVNKVEAIEHAQNCDKSPLVRRILALEKRIEDLYTGDSGAECIVCERITANGTCTECRHGTSPLKLALARAEKAEKCADELDTIVKMCDEALDEFGAGYCSLNNASAKPEDVVKAVIEAMATLRGRIKYKD